jgi:hypothetical protein
MINFLRDLRKSEEEKRQEALSAYLDDALTPAEKDRFEQLLATDETLRASLQEQRLIRASLGRLPRMRAPRNFTLDPALYGRPVPSTSERLYPVMRTATALVAILFVVVLVLDFIPSGSRSQEDELGPVTMFQQTVAVEESAAGEAPAAELPAEAPLAEPERIGEIPVEVTREVEELGMAPEAAAAEEAVAEEAAAEEAVEEAPLEEEAVEEIESVAPGDALGGGSDEAALPAEEAPLAQVLPPAREGGVPATPEADTAADPATDERSEYLATIVAAKTEEGAAEITPTEEDLAGPPMPNQTPSAPTGADDGDGIDGEGIIAATTTTLPTTQILAIVLGLSLIMLAAATLILRRWAR